MKTSFKRQRSITQENEIIAMNSVFYISKMELSKSTNSEGHCLRTIGVLSFKKSLYLKNANFAILSSYLILC